MRDELSRRGSLDWAPSDALSVGLKAERSTFDVKGRQIEVIQDVAGPVPGGAPFGPTLAFLGFPGAIGDTELDFTRDADADDHSDNELQNVTLSAEWQLGEYSLTSTTAKVGYDFSERCDCDFIGAPVFFLDLDENYDQVSQEFRLVSPLFDNFDWLAGIYYQDSELKFRDNAVFPAGGVGSHPAVLGGVLGGNSTQRNFEQDTKVYSAFGQFTWNATDRTRATVGLRWTREEKDATKQLDAIDVASGMPATSPALIATLEGGLGVITNQGSGHDLDASRSENKLSGALNIEHDVNDDVLAYASVTKGVKSGGFDARSNTPTNFEFEDEEAVAYEVGMKSQWMDGRLEVNAALYRTEYDDLQISQFDGGLGFNVGNAKETIVQGLELDGRFSLTDYMTINYSFAYLDHEYEDFRNGNCFAFQTPDGDTVDGITLCDYSGKSGQYTPEYSANVGWEYLQPLGGEIDLRFSVDVNWVDEQNVHVNLAPEGEIDAYALVDVGIYLEAEDWRLGLLVKNATDEEIVTYQGNTPLSSTFRADTQYGFIAQPRTVVLQASRILRDF